MFRPVVKIKIYQEDLVFGPGLIMLLEQIQKDKSR